MVTATDTRVTNATCLVTFREVERPSLPDVIDQLEKLNLVLELTGAYASASSPSLFKVSSGDQLPPPNVVRAMQVLRVSYNSPLEVLVSTPAGVWAAPGLFILAALPKIFRAYSRLRVDFAADKLEKARLQRVHAAMMAGFIHTDDSFAEALSEATETPHPEVKLAPAMDAIERVVFEDGTTEISSGDAQ